MKPMHNFLAAAAALILASTASATTVFHQLASFEDGIPAALSPQNGAVFTQETLGATDGASSLGVEFTDARLTANDGPLQHIYFGFDATNDNFAKWQEAATLQLTTPRRFAVAYDLYLDFGGTLLPPGATLFAHDFRYNQDADPAAVPNPIPGFQDTGGEYGIPTRYDAPFPTAAESITIVTPFDDDDNARSFFINPNATVFYQLQLGHKYDPVDLGGSAKVYYDNFRIVEYESPTEQVLFSWETPDVVGTPENEQLQGWGPGASVAANPLANHARSITTVGATDGPSAMQINTPAGIAAPAFTWGSAHTYTQAAEVNQVAAAIDNGERIEIDLTFDGSAKGTASYFSFFMHISDSDGNFYQSPASQYEISNLGGGQTDTLKVQFGFREFRAAADPTRLLSEDTLLGTTSLAIGIGTNEDSIQTVRISVDKMRIISEELTVEEDADFDGDNDIDGADFLAWQRGFGKTGGATLAEGDANGDGNVDNADFTIFRRQFGEPVPIAGAVPEAGTAALAVAGLLAVAFGRRIHRRVH